MPTFIGGLGRAERRWEDVAIRHSSVDTFAYLRSPVMFSPIAADHLYHPRRRGRLAEATHFGASGVRGDGPFVELWLRVENGIVRDAAYETHGCPSSIVAASMLCELAIGRE